MNRIGSHLQNMKVVRDSRIVRKRCSFRNLGVRLRLVGNTVIGAG